jgi:hypothetical protein
VVLTYSDISAGDINTDPRGRLIFTRVEPESIPGVQHAG